MRRVHPTPSIEEALAVCEQLLRGQDGLRLLQAQLPPGTSLEETRRIRERSLQHQRRASACMLHVIDAHP